MSEASTSGLNPSNCERPRIYVPRNATQMHMIYGEAEKDGPTSKCVVIDMQSALISFDIITESQLGVVHIWYKLALNQRDHCTKIIYHVGDEIIEQCAPEANANIYIDDVESIDLGANMAVIDPDFFLDDYGIHSSENGHTCDVNNIEHCEFCFWAGSIFDMDNHYMEYHANRTVLKEPFDNFDYYF